MGNWFTTVWAAGAETSQQSESQREAGRSPVTAQHGGVFNSPQYSGVLVQGNLINNINTYDPSPDRTDETNAVPPRPQENIQRCQAELKAYLENTTKTLCQGTKADGSSTLLNKIYTELYITEGGSGEVNNEHEVIKLECKRCSNEEQQIHLKDIFKPLSNEEDPPQRVLTKGIAGIGKTVAVQKFTRDWATGETNQNYQFVFPFTFRDFNLIKDDCWSLMTLICYYFEEVKDLETSDYSNSNVLFILDGLDESRLPLDFENNELCRSVTKTTTLDTLLTNLITGKLLHKALIWITSRPAAAAKIPSEIFNRVTEVRGFNDEQKEEYFKKKVSGKVMPQKILDHLQSKPMRSLYIMCHIPVFCWISATALESLLQEARQHELPKTVTEMYTHFLIVQTTLKHQKDYQKSEADKDLIMKLGKLAFEQLQKGNIIFYENDLRSCEIDLKQAAVYSGVCTQIIRKEYGIHKEEIYSFIHLSVHEFLAALYVLETFLTTGQNLLPKQKNVNIASEKKKPSVLPLYKNAVNMALANNYGHWDMFLRFLLGLSQDKNQQLLVRLLGSKWKRPHSNQETILYIHEMIKKLFNTDKIINLFHCLNELGDHSLVQQVQKHQSSGDVRKILPEHWSALAFLLLVSNEDLDVFDLKKYSRSDEVLERLLPVLKASKTAVLSDCNLTDRCCKCLLSALIVKSSDLEELDLSRNDVQDSGLMELSVGLMSPDCKLQRLRLAGCRFTNNGFAALASSLKSNSAHLRVLDLAQNNLRYSDFQSLSEFLVEPRCQLETLSLNSCRLTSACCQSLASALSNSSTLKELNLSYNSLMDEGVTLLSDWLNKPQCRLEILRLAACQFTDSGCTALASGLISNPAHLRVLDLAQNDLEGDDVGNLPEFLAEPRCRLETLNLKSCRLTAACCQALTSALSGSSTLKELELSYNNLTDEGLMPLSDWLSKPQCRLEILRLASCQFADSGFAAVASSLELNPDHLRVLDLAQNKLRDADVENLYAFLSEPRCRLETLNMRSCRLTAACCKTLTIALSGFSALKELDLSYNSLMDQGVKLFSDWLKKSKCRLEILRLAGCQFENSGFAALASSLKSNPAHLRVLDLAQNMLEDSDFKRFSQFLALPRCRLEMLNLRSCSIKATSCQSLTSALSNSSALKELDLSYNHLMDEGLKQLSDWLSKPECTLEILSLEDCQFKKNGLAALASSLKSNPTHLKVLDLAENTLQNCDAENLSEFLAKPLCQLERMNLKSCRLTAVSCHALTSALSSGSSTLKELDLSYNNLRNQGLMPLSDWLSKPQCRLEILRLAGCQFTNHGFAALASSLTLNPAHLRVLDLAQNDIEDGDVESLSHFLSEPLCELETLNLNSCKLTAASCKALASVLSGSSALKELNLSYNNLTDLGLTLLSDWLSKPQCRLEILRLSECTEIGCESLALALESNPSHLRELELSWSNPGKSGLKLLSDLRENKRYKLQTLKVTN